MREVSSVLITQTVKNLFIRANINIPDDIKRRVAQCIEKEKSAQAQGILRLIQENWKLAEENSLPVCQDTGMACVFISIGQDVHVTGKGIREAVNDGISQACRDGALRASVVSDPLDRINTSDNTPAVIYFDICSGENIEITVVPKGFGSENMSRIAMLKPAEGKQGVMDFVIDTVKKAGPNPCPPIVVGVGIGGTFDSVSLLAKKALARSTDIPNSSKLYADMEASLLEEINRTGTGPAGFGGRTTALAVNIEQMPTHIAGLPVAVNISCHVTRRMSAVI